MALFNIRGQRIVFGTDRELSYNCEAQPADCTLLKKTDILRTQLRQTPCGDNLVCNGDFDTSENLLSNGDFSDGDTDWSAESAITITDKACWTPGSGDQSIVQALSITEGTIYLISFTVSGMSDGEITPGVGVTGTMNGTAITENGSYVQAIAGGAVDQIEFLGDNDFDGCIDDVSLVTVDCWQLGDGWTVQEGFAQHDPGDSGYLTEEIYTSLTANDYVSVSLTVVSMTAGSIVVYIGGTEAGTITEPGTYDFFVVTSLSDSDLKIFASDDCDVRLTVQSSYKYLNIQELGSGATIVDANGNIIAGTSYIGLYQDRIAYKWELGSIGVIEDGCYSLMIADPCQDLSALSRTEINSDVTMETSGDWDIHNAGTENVLSVTPGLGGHFNCHLLLTSGNTEAYMAQAHSFTPGTYLVEVEVEIAAWPSQQFLQAYLVLPTGSTADMFPIVPISPAALPPPGVSSYTCRSVFAVTINNPSTSNFGLYNLHDKFALAFNSTGTIEDDENRINSISIKLSAITAGTEGNYFLESNCFKVQTDVTDSLLLFGYPVEDADNFPSFTGDPIDSHGFIFWNDFPYLEQRIFGSFQNPHFPIKSDSYAYSSPYKRKSYSINDELWDFNIFPVDIVAHRCIERMIGMQHFFIGSSLVDVDEYTTEDKIYDPDWPAKGASNMAEASIEISKIDSQSYK